ncbi:NADH dehydrogenase [Candidatus Hydrogenisulfobacillus filiaventi]|uniref:NADH dehydrogenase n=1 Tax=Candidatus Hydrogenisulfobacillus filiaventi TaxID=2707344 RepID=A0A6F8ZJF1_9FIRM|nr:complex I NDUFA9 subunit family protein [Bacillota bacterium]CAB1129916.1 NADH dehydrogenase [Candidatus Hydrogenisulfobacillus filiaventi]
MRVVVFGGTGYVGSAVCRALVEQGHQPVAVARRGPVAAGAELAAADARRDELAPLLAGADAAINLIGIIREEPAQGVTFETMHVAVARRVIAALQRAGVRRLLQMSALGTRPGARSRYHQTKWAAEEAVRASGLSWTIVRPSLLFGGGAPFFVMLQDQVRRLPVVPVPGDGRSRLQPVWREDVARLIALALPDPESVGQVYEVGGPRVYSLDELYDAVGRTVGRPRVPKLHLPLGPLMAAARLGERLPGFPVTVDQLWMLTEDNTTGDTRWHRLVPRPAPLEGDL